MYIFGNIHVYIYTYPKNSVCRTGHSTFKIYCKGSSIEEERENWLNWLLSLLLLLFWMVGVDGIDGIGGIEEEAEEGEKIEEKEEEGVEIPTLVS